MWVLLFSLSIKGIILLSCLYYASISLCALYLCMPMNPYLCFTIVFELDWEPQILWGCGTKFGIKATLRTYFVKGSSPAYFIGDFEFLEEPCT